jgi:hypothetical protein
MAQVDTTRWTIGLTARRYTLGGRGWQVELHLPVVKLIYTTRPRLVA